MISCRYEGDEIASVAVAPEILTGDVEGPPLRCKPKRTAKATAKKAPNSKFGKAVTTARKRKGISQRKLAQLAKVSQPCVCNIENSVYAAGPKLKARLSKILGLK